VRTIGHCGLDVGWSGWSAGRAQGRGTAKQDVTQTALTVNAHLAIRSVSCLMDIRAAAMRANECLNRDVSLSPSRGGHAWYWPFPAPAQYLRTVITAKASPWRRLLTGVLTASSPALDPTSTPTPASPGTALRVITYNRKPQGCFQATGRTKSAA
jgi:hypothetical protein